MAVSAHGLFGIPIQDGQALDVALHHIGGIDSYGVAVVQGHQARAHRKVARGLQQAGLIGVFKCQVNPVVGCGQTIASVV